MDYLFLIVGLGLLLLSADYLVDSSVAIAQRAKISNFIIGLTIVGMGTSAPELFVGVKSALAGDGDIAMGNVIGSNIANVLLILGVAGMILPFDIERTTIRRDIPFGIGAAALLFLVANDKLIPGIQENTISRVDAVFFLVLFLCYMGYVVVQKGKDPQKPTRRQRANLPASIPRCSGSSRWCRSWGSLAAVTSFSMPPRNSPPTGA